MAATPPAQIRAEPRTPPTPLHGSAYHDESSPRYNFRSSIKRTPEPAQRSQAQTPRSTKSDRATSLHSSLHSPQTTPKRKAGRRAQVMSPTSPESQDSVSSSLRPTAKQQHLLPTGTIMTEGMLPTPVKTPRKKQAPKSQVAARALFQDAENPENLFKSPRKRQKPARHNGFSLESFTADGDSQDQIQIFTDSRDRVPEVDTSESNPFYEAPSQPHKVQGTSKRRKINGATKVPDTRDPQVQEAIDHDDGMVYVFRGKKVYRRFDDGGEEEEVIDTDDIDFDRQRSSARSKRQIKTLTRKSIQPKRLFQAPEDQQVDEEEAETEIEDHPEETIHSTNASPRKRARTDEPASSSKPKKSSPFDSWQRVKPGSTTAQTSGRKRTADEAIAT